RQSPVRSADRTLARRPPKRSSSGTTRSRRSLPRQPAPPRHHRTPRHHHHALRPATARGTDGARAAHHHTFGLLHRHGRGTAPHPTPGLPVRDHPRTRTRNLTPHRRVRRDRPTTLRTRQHPRTGALHALP